MGGFLGIGGSSAKTDRKQQLAGYGQLSNVFSFGLPTAEKGAATAADTQKAGISSLDQAKGYWQRLLSGDRTQMRQAAAPEINAATEQSDAARRGAAASGTARGGGAAGGAQAGQTDLMSKIDNLLFGVRPAAAEQTAKIGSAESEIGVQQMQQALNALGISGSAADALTRIAAGSRETSYGINRQTQQDVISAIGQLLSFA